MIRAAICEPPAKAAVAFTLRLPTTAPAAAGTLTRRWLATSAPVVASSWTYDAVAPELERRQVRVVDGAELFVQALRPCKRARLVGLGTLAVDGTKLRANASRHKAMSYERMTKKETELQAEIAALRANVDALAIYWRAVEDALETADRRNYAQAVRLLTHAKTAAAAAGQGDDFRAGLAALREQHRRRPTLIAMLNKAKLDSPADNR